MLMAGLAYPYMPTVSSFSISVSRLVPQQHEQQQRQHLHLCHGRSPCLFAHSEPPLKNQQNSSSSKIRSHLRTMTGFSFTALRATWRAATGISLTAVSGACWAATSGAVRNSMAATLQIFPAWARYFLQPFLILYYVPLFMVRTLTDRTTMNAQQRKHEAWIQNFTSTREDVITVVENDGTIEAVKPPDSYR
jgi:hypothetical protein